MNLTAEDVQNILRIIDSPCVELRLETADFKLFVRKVPHAHSGASALSQPSGPNDSGERHGDPTPAAFATRIVDRLQSVPAEEPVGSAQPYDSPGARSAASRPLAAGETAVVSPMVGTFYRAPAPGAPPFVEVGDGVEPDSIICIIEVMKLMNSIRAERRGRVVDILVENAESVRDGQTLIILGPEA